MDLHIEPSPEFHRGASHHVVMPVRERVKNSVIDHPAGVNVAVPAAVAVVATVAVAAATEAALEARQDTDPRPSAARERT